MHTDENRAYQQPFRNYDEAIRVMQRAAAIPKNIKINYHDHVRQIGTKKSIHPDNIVRHYPFKPDCSSR